MNSKAAQTARDAGFLTQDEISRQHTTCNAEAPENSIGLDVVPSNIMPEGWFGLRTSKGVMCVGPNGSFWVPAFDPMRPLPFEGQG